MAGVERGNYVMRMTRPAATPSIDRVAQIAINVHEIERAVEFYRDVLGLRLLFRAPPGLAFFACGGVRLMLSAPENGEHDHPSSVIYYAVPDVIDVHRSLSARGVSFEDQPHVIARMEGVDIWMVFLKDPEGNLLALTSESRPPSENL